MTPAERSTLRSRLESLKSAERAEEMLRLITKSPRDSEFSIRIDMGGKWNGLYPKDVGVGQFVRGPFVDILRKFIKDRLNEARETTADEEPAP